MKFPALPNAGTYGGRQYGSQRHRSAVQNQHAANDTDSHYLWISMAKIKLVVIGITSIVFFSTRVLPTYISKGKQFYKVQHEKWHSPHSRLSFSPCQRQQLSYLFKLILLAFASIIPNRLFLDTIFYIIFFSGFLLNQIAGITSPMFQM